MKKKPLIGISCGTGLTEITGNADQLPLTQHRLNDSYVQSVVQAGGIPVIFPSFGDPMLMQAMVDGVDGVILSGGCDVDPCRYDLRPTEKLGAVSPRRDAAELALAEYVIAHTQKPLLGICRGIQVMNVALGGSLYLDLPSEGKPDHSLTMYPRHVTSHKVEVEEHTELARILGSAGIHSVNSFHHQAVNRPGRGLIVTARSVPDGVVEAVELPGSRFVLGVQWHPEELRHLEDAAALFRAFVAAARK